MKVENPQNMEEAQLPQGTIKYLARQIPRLYEVMEHIRNLTRSNTEWEWTELQDKSMKEVQRMVTKHQYWLSTTIRKS